MEQTTGSVGSRIKALRKDRGMTASALAGRVGVTENAIRKIESGDSREPRFSTAMEIARVLEVEPNALEGLVSGTARALVAPQLAQILSLFRASKGALQDRGVRRLSIFGSVARGSARADSDVDALLEVAPGFTLFDLVAVGDILEKAAGRRVDVATKASMARSPFADAIQRESVDVF